MNHLFLSIQENLENLQDAVLKGMHETDLQDERLAHVDNINTFLSFFIMADLRNFL